MLRKILRIIYIKKSNNDNTIIWLLLIESRHDMYMSAFCITNAVT